MPSEAPFVCPRCLKLIPFDKVKSSDDEAEGIHVEGVLVFHLECWNAYIDAHVDDDPEGESDA
jgi:hypothetical protein